MSLFFTGCERIVRCLPDQSDRSIASIIVGIFGPWHRSHEPPSPALFLTSSCLARWRCYCLSLLTKILKLISRYLKFEILAQFFHISFKGCQICTGPDTAKERPQGLIIIPVSTSSIIRKNHSSFDTKIAYIER